MDGQRTLIITHKLSSLSYWKASEQHIAQPESFAVFCDAGTFGNGFFHRVW
uniref:Uncharacterized protein n=1 Tax=Arundo donax TaxID=35708 RepID=A0A0A8YDM1_ARUDO